MRSRQLGYAYRYQYNRVSGHGINNIVVFALHISGGAPTTPGMPWDELRL
ncbi:hypothetical protein [Microseira wollei]|nr:hypothetical protein [Microseira wollei]